MSEHLFRFLLTELVTVRVVCGHCKAIIEVPTDELDKVFRTGVCHVCTMPLQLPGRNHLAQLAEAIRWLGTEQDKLKVEFVIPIKE